MRFRIRLPHLRRHIVHVPWKTWALLVVLSAILVAALEALNLPAALLLGPIFAGIVLAAREKVVHVPAPAFYFSQGIVGCMIAGNIPLSIAGELLKDWPLFLIGVVSAIVVASLLGWLLTHWRVLPGTTAIWGLSPGAATAMTLMAEDFGADMRLVAFMQYLRVVCVAVVATMVAKLWTDSTATAPAIVWFPPTPWLSLSATLLLAIVGGFLARLFRVPAGPLLVPMVAGIVLSQCGLMTITLPPWLLAVSYAFVGWSIGLRFTRQVLVHAAHAFPRVLASIVILIAACSLFAVVLVKAAGIDPLTAYLAVSPGGADSVAIIAASSNVDLPFVMAMQTVRLVLVLLVSPGISRFIARKVGG